MEWEEEEEIEVLLHEEGDLSILMIDVMNVEKEVIMQGIVTGTEVLEEGKYKTKKKYF